MIMHVYKFTSICLQKRLQYFWIDILYVGL